MNRDDIKAKLNPVFRTTFSDESLVLRDDMTADDVAEWDSLSHISLVVAVEKTFGIKLTTREVRGMKNVGDLIGIISQKAA